MNSLKITVGCLFAALFLIISCEQEEKILPPSLKLSQTELAVSAAGGQVSLDYTSRMPLRAPQSLLNQWKLLTGYQILMSR